MKKIILVILFPFLIFVGIRIIKLAFILNKDAFALIVTAPDPKFIDSLKQTFVFLIAIILIAFFYYKGYKKNNIRILKKMIVKYCLFLFSILLGYLTTFIIIKNINFSPPEMKFLLIVIFLIAGFLFFMGYDHVDKKLIKG